jgi:hypothetical protein
MKQLQACMKQTEGCMNETEGCMKETQPCIKQATMNVSYIRSAKPTRVSALAGFDFRSYA